MIKYSLLQKSSSYKFKCSYIKNKTFMTACSHFNLIKNAYIKERSQLMIFFQRCLIRNLWKNVSIFSILLVDVVFELL